MVQPASNRMVTEAALAADVAVKINAGTVLDDALEAKIMMLSNAARNPDLLIAGAITRDANDAITSAPVLWPDGSAGTYTADVVSTAFPGVVDGYHITHTSDPIHTFTQPTVTRNSRGAVTTLPALVVS